MQELYVNFSMDFESHFSLESSASRLCKTRKQEIPEWLGRAASPPLKAENNYATKSPLVTVGRPKFTPKLPLPLGDLQPHLIHPSLDRPRSPSQTACQSSWPFFHNSSAGQTDRQTDRQMAQATGLYRQPLTLY